MLEIEVQKEQEYWDREKGVFVYTTLGKPVTVRLEHSLISISKWEAHYKKAFLPSRYAKGIAGLDEKKYYVRCMVIGSVSEEVYSILETQHIVEIFNYIETPQTASIIHEIGSTSQKQSSQTITADLIYFWLVNFTIPFEVEKWHFSRLLALLNICRVKAEEQTGKKGNKLSREEAIRWQHEMNQKRLAQIKGAL